MRLIDASEGEGLEVVYKGADGSELIKKGGSRSWRNSNPGNIINSSFADRHGAIGRAGGFAVFPDKEIGTQAIVSLLKVKSYQSRTMEEAMNRYAPKHENDTEAYISFIEKRTRISRDTPMSDLSDEELESIVGAIETFEGYFEGEVIEKAAQRRYIWRTQNDKKVRSSHADREGQVYYYNNPPEGGNPGEDFGCRCWAEPLDENFDK